MIIVLIVMAGIAGMAGTDLGPYSQNFIFLVTYEWPDKLEW
jgi:hypothetical protein